MLEDERKVKKEQIIEYLRRFPFYKWAASFVAINQDTLKDWRTEDKDFSDRVETARSEGMRFYGGKATPDLILKSADPQTFKERVDVTTGDKPLPILPIDVLTNNSNKKDIPTE